MLVHAITTNATYEFASEVRAGLARSGQKELPSKYLYDDVGSALFEVISHLPEYGLTRADERLLQRHAGEIVERQTLIGSSESVLGQVADERLLQRHAGEIVERQ